MSTQGRAPKSGFDRQQPPRAQSNSGMASPARHGPVLAFGGAKPSGGAPLPSSLRAELEARFGAELGSVRVHADGVGAQSAGAVQHRRPSMAAACWRAEPCRQATPSPMAAPRSRSQAPVQSVLPPI